jgi:hypothetical protein
VLEAVTAELRERLSAIGEAVGAAGTTGVVTARVPITSP